MLFWLLTGFVALGTAALARFAFLHASEGSAVDHYYWVLAARAYRTATELPVRIHRKYLLEDERQAYPLGFGLFLTAFSDEFLRSQRSLLIVVAVDCFTLFLVVAAGVAMGMAPLGIIAIILVYGLAPVLVAYNTQLTSRSLGNFFLVFSLLAQVLAASLTGYLQVFCVVLGIVALAMVFVTHKMTTQFLLFLWPVWIVVLAELGSFGIWIGAVTPILALFSATLVTGIEYQILQWAAHWDIVTFWHRNWRFLGAHQFKQSPIYGNMDARAPNAFHGEGLSGFGRHAILLAAYLPVMIPLPATVFISGWPPAFVTVWSVMAIFAALLTLYVPDLKCLGGGHLYLFNAVPPVALWWGYTLSAEEKFGSTSLLFVFGMALTALSIIGGLRRRSRAHKPEDHDPLLIISRLQREPATNVAVFPVTFAERIALETDHAVFWGGHGLGFSTLEMYWPVMRQPIGEALRSWGVTHAILDLKWWPEGKAVFDTELGDTDPEYHGDYILYRVSS